MHSLPTPPRNLCNGLWRLFKPLIYLKTVLPLPCASDPPTTPSHFTCLYMRGGVASGVLTQMSGPHHFPVAFYSQQIAWWPREHPPALARWRQPPCSWPRLKASPWDTTPPCGHLMHCLPSCERGPHRSSPHTISSNWRRTPRGPQPDIRAVWPTQPGHLAS
ncbi:hypothetical protein G0U57_008440 [Chelydra serpentina]|uniref:Uncharacterized protein n=1 Tax=Chelydra serpentina TaxID=8475 RepID=A0A8T1RXH9_CHESE|nr:hypothetical protein G0U57_008440 [Chelydra serpentina]